MFAPIRRVLAISPLAVGLVSPPAASAATVPPLLDCLAG